MGRPIKKTKMSVDNTLAGSNEALTGKIAVTAFRTGGSTTSSTVAYIVSQRGSRQFKIHLDDSSEIVATLTAVAPGSLSGTHNSFTVQVILDDSTVAYVSKFFNNTVHYVTAGGATGNAPYSLLAEGTDEGQVAGKANVNVR